MQQQNYNEKNMDNKVEEIMSKKYTDSFKYRVSRKVLILCNPLKMRRISNVILKKPVMSPSGTTKSPAFSKEGSGTSSSMRRWGTVEHAALVDAQYQSL